MDVNLNKLQALVSLLEDDDVGILQQIESEILLMGTNALKALEDSFLQVESNEHKERLEQVINKIRNAAIRNDLKVWLVSKEKDLIEAWCIISSISGNRPIYQEIKNELDKIKLEVWLGMHNDQSSLEKISLLNHIFFHKVGFQGDNHNYLSPSNSFIHEVFQRKKGNPISLAVLYMLIAQSLKMPVYGINLPQHFVLAYLPLDMDLLDELSVEDLKKGNDISMPVDLNSEPVFYINVFNKGSVFSKKHLIGFLAELKLQPKPEFYKVCDEKNIMLRMLRNLQTAYLKQNNSKGLEQIEDLLTLFIDEN